MKKVNSNTACPCSIINHNNNYSTLCQTSFVRNSFSGKTETCQIVISGYGIIDATMEL